MPKNKIDFNKTAKELERHDNQIKLGLLAAAATTLLFRKPGKVLGLITAYQAGTRQLTLANHQQARQTNKDEHGNLPVDPYLGFFGGSEEARKATKVFSELSQIATKAYKASGAEKQVEEIIEKISPSK